MAYTAILWADKTGREGEMATGAAVISDEGLAERLTAFLKVELGAEALAVEGLHRASYGLSRENWPFDVAWRGADGQARREALILRRDPVGSMLNTDRVAEFKLLRALGDVAAPPTPEARWLDADGAVFGRPTVIMVRHAGVCDPFVLAGGVSGLAPERRLDLARRFMDALVQVHAVDWRALGLAEFLPAPTAPEAAGEALDHWEGVLRREAVEPLPELELILAWLRANKPASDDVVLVHGDFKPGNTLIEGDRVAVVLDWETAHLGDPMEDLGWVTNPMRAGEHQIPGVWETEAMLDHYAAITGRTVSRARVRWWRVFAMFKLEIIALTGVRSFIDGRFDRVLASRLYSLNTMLDQMQA
jgi:aminoglycoside phosphotransferase (APT) family kinase protein